MESPSPEDKAKRATRMKKRLKRTALALFFQTSGWVATIQANPDILMNMYGGDGVRAATAAASMTSAGAVLEFLSVSAIGKWSDSIGRRCFLVAAPLLQGLHRVLFFLYPTEGMLWSQRIMFQPLNKAYFTILQASDSDIMTPQEVAASAGMPAMAAGMGLIVGPALGTILSSRFGSSVYAFPVGFMFNFSVAVLGYFEFDETLDDSLRKPFKLSLQSFNPLSFCKLFSQNALMTKMSCVQLFNSMGNGPHTNDVNIIFMKERLGLDQTAVGRFMSIWGASVIGSGAATKPLISALGTLAFSRFAVAVSMVSYATWGFASSEAMLLCSMGLQLLGGHQRSSAVGAIITGLGSKLGWGKGEMAAMIGNMDTVTKVIFPVVYAKAYAAGKVAGVSGLPFWICSLWMALSALILQTVSQQRIDAALN